MQRSWWVAMLFSFFFSGVSLNHVLCIYTRYISFAIGGREVPQFDCTEWQLLIVHRLPLVSTQSRSTCDIYVWNPLQGNEYDIAVCGFKSIYWMGCCCPGAILAMGVGGLRLPHYGRVTNSILCWHGSSACLLLLDNNVSWPRRQALSWYAGIFATHVSSNDR